MFAIILEDHVFKDKEDDEGEEEAQENTAEGQGILMTCCEQTFMSERAYKKHCFTHKAIYKLIKNEDVIKTFSELRPYQSYSLCEYFNAAVPKIFPVLFNYKGGLCELEEFAATDPNLHLHNVIQGSPDKQVKLKAKCVILTATGKEVDVSKFICPPTTNHVRKDKPDFKVTKEHGDYIITSSMPSSKPLLESEENEEEDDSLTIFSTSPESTPSSSQVLNTVSENWSPAKRLKPDFAGICAGGEWESPGQLAVANSFPQPYYDYIIGPAGDSEGPGAPHPGPGGPGYPYPGPGGPGYSHPGPGGPGDPNTGPGGPGDPNPGPGGPGAPHPGPGRPGAPHPGPGGPGNPNPGPGGPGAPHPGPGRPGDPNPGPGGPGNPNPGPGGPGDPNPGPGGPGDPNPGPGRPGDPNPGPGGPGAPHPGPGRPGAPHPGPGGPGAGDGNPGGVALPYTGPMPDIGDVGGLNILQACNIIRRTPMSFRSSRFILRQGQPPTLIPTRVNNPLIPTQIPSVEFIWGPG